MSKLGTSIGAGYRGPALDAIVMPTSRRLDEPRSGIATAAALADDIEVETGRRPPVVVVCSGAARSEHLPRDMFGRTPVLCVDLPPGYRPPWPALITDDHRLSRYRRNNDVGLKRNLGLVIARMQGWQNVLLLDDDVSRLRSRDGGLTSHFGVGNLADATLALNDPQVRAVGWILDDFPDNSVVCHARRLAGLSQEKFVGGGSLLVRCDERLPFFPATYNEDWLFLLPMMLQEDHPGAAVVEGGLLGQDPINVFKKSRAVSEELGDVLAEGLYNLLPESRREFVRLSHDEEYWRAVVGARIVMMRGVVGRLARMSKGNGPSRATLNAAAEAVMAALSVHPEAVASGQTGPPARGVVADRPEVTWAGDLACYCRLWRRDLEAWGEWLPRVEPGRPLSTLGLGSRARWTSPVLVG